MRALSVFPMACQLMENVTCRPVPNGCWGKSGPSASVSLTLGDLSLNKVTDRKQAFADLQNRSFQRQSFGSGPLGLALALNPGCAQLSPA